MEENNMICKFKYSSFNDSYVMKNDKCIEILTKITLEIYLNKIS